MKVKSESEVAQSCPALSDPWTAANQAPPSMGFSRQEYQRRQWHPTPVLLPGESQGRGSLVGCRLWGRTESDTTEAT